MVCYHSSIVVDQQLGMAKSVNPTDLYSKSKQVNHLHRKKTIPNFQNQLNIPACEQSAYAIIDVIIMIAVIGACGVLLYPYVKLIVCGFFEFVNEFGYLLKDEMIRNPMIYTCLALSMLFAAVALFAITLYTNRSCGKPGCQGLQKAAEFDIQLETEDCVKNSNYVAKNGMKKGLFELPLDHHKDLEAELKKMAPPNGRAVLVFRARCGCSVGRMEVPGPRKPRRIKK